MFCNGPRVVYMTLVQFLCGHWLAFGSQYKGSCIPSTKSQFMDDNMMRLVSQWLEWVLWVPLIAVTLSVKWQEGHPECKKTCFSCPKDSHLGLLTKPGVTRGKRPVKQKKMCVCCVSCIQEISSLDAREIAFIVLEQLPDVTNLNQDTFQVVWRSVWYEKIHFLCCIIWGLRCVLDFPAVDTHGPTAPSLPLRTSCHARTTPSQPRPLPTVACVAAHRPRPASRS